MTHFSPGVRRWLHFLRRTPLHPQWLLGVNNKTASWVGTNARGRVLDIGCSDQWARAQLAHGCEYVGLDYPSTGGGLYGACPDIFADAAYLPFADSSFDTVLLLEVLEHVRQPQLALAEIARVLAPQGRLLMSMPFLYPLHDAPHDYQRYTWHGIERELDVAGLTSGDIRPRLGAAATGAMLLNLALGGMLMEAVRRRRPGVLLAPLIGLAICTSNLLGRLFDRLLPVWDNMTNGFTVIAMRKESLPEHQLSHRSDTRPREVKG